MQCDYSFKCVCVDVVAEDKVEVSREDDWWWWGQGSRWEVSYWWVLF
jgi:hypothetical protein